MIMLTMEGKESQSVGLSVANVAQPLMITKNVVFRNRHEVTVTL